MIEGVISFVGIGSNLNGALEHCREAVDRIAATDGMEVLRTSSWYRTEPVGFQDQDWFINAVVEVRTVLSAHMLLQALQGIEHHMGRVRETERRWGPRIIDLDILLYGQDVIQEENLVVPHPHLHKRRFVLVPLCELASYAIHPAFGISMKGLLDRLEDASKVELL